MLGVLNSLSHYSPRRGSQHAAMRTQSQATWKGHVSLLAKWRTASAHALAALKRDRLQQLSRTSRMANRCPENQRCQLSWHTQLQPPHGRNTTVRSCHLCLYLRPETALPNSGLAQVVLSFLPKLTFLGLRLSVSFQKTNKGKSKVPLPPPLEPGAFRKSFCISKSQCVSQVHFLNFFFFSLCILFPKKSSPSSHSQSCSKF